jgi:hypothetical protein
MGSHIRQKYSNQHAAGAAGDANHRMRDDRSRQPVAASPHSHRLVSSSTMRRKLKRYL